MPLLADRVRETTTTTGQGTLTLDGAPSGFRTFTGAFGNGASVYYVIAGPSEWEIGFGTTGAGTLTRDTVLVSSAGGTTKVTFSAGTKDVFCSYVADRAVTTSDAATLTNKTIDDYTNNVGANSTHFRIKAGATLVKGDVVKASGFTPGEQAIEVVKVASSTDVALGFVEQALSTGQFGMAVVIGELFDVNTNGLAVGATLYSNNAGSYTTTKPSSGLYQSLGWVVRANLNNGVIAVNVVAPLYVETSTNTANTAVLRDGSGNFAANAGLFGNGTVGAPALAASADTNTGLYFPEADALAFTTGGTARMRIGATGDVAVDTDTLYVDATNNRVSVGATALSASNNYGVPQLGTASDAFSTFHVEAHNNTAGNYSFIGLMRSRGTRAAPTHVQNGDPIGNLDAQVYNDAGSFPYRRSAAIQFVASGNHAAGSLPTDIAFLTTPSGSNSTSERWRINSSGHLLAGADASFDIGASGANRPRDLFLGRNATVAGNLTVDTNTLFVDATNNRVGVGVTSTIAQLCNTSTSDSITGVQPTGFVWRSTDNDWAAAIISRPASGLSYALRVHSGGTTASDYPLWISSGASTGTLLLAVNGAGNLGLGVTPSARLDVSGATIMRGNLTFSADATYDIGASGATRPRDLFLSRNMVGGGWMRAGAASAGAASTTTIGSTTSTTVGATGAADVLPANPLGYIVAHVGTTEVRIPYYNA